MFHCLPRPRSHVDRLAMAFCGPARDTVLTNRQTEKSKFNTSYITILLVVLYCVAHIVYMET